MKVLKSWGTEGQVVLSLSPDDPEDLDLEEPVFINFDGLPVPFFFESIESKGNRYIVKFEDVDSLKEAEELVGRTATVEDEYETEGDDDIVGMTVKDASGRVIGPVTDVADYSGNTCITVEYEGKDVLLPFHEDLVVEVTDDSIILNIPEGLL
ncbi:MAG: 16S rRNA processing protein RimM [Bacteroidales bacterium]|nr:16S rRNA processing protein RimM [Candidatus Cacconaster merdequi]